MVTVSASNKNHTVKPQHPSHVLVNTATVLVRHIKLLWQQKRKMLVKFINAHIVTSPVRGQITSSDTCCDTRERDLTSAPTVTSVPRDHTLSKNTLKISTIKISEGMNLLKVSIIRISELMAWLKIFTTRILDRMVLLDKMYFVFKFL